MLSFGRLPTENHAAERVIPRYPALDHGDRERRLWQPTRHLVQIETKHFWQAKIDYLHQNPVRKGLVKEAEHCRFSSASYWASGGKTDNDVLLSAIVW